MYLCRWIWSPNLYNRPQALNAAHDSASRISCLQLNPEQQCLTFCGSQTAYPENWAPSQSLGLRSSFRHAAYTPGTSPENRGHLEMTRGCRSSAAVLCEASTYVRCVQHEIARSVNSIASCFQPPAGRDKIALYRYGQVHAHICDRTECFEPCRKSTGFHNPCGKTGNLVFFGAC